MLLLRWACARGATWKHLKLLSSKRGLQTKLPLSNEGGNECVSGIDSFWCRDDHWELVSERQRDGGRREVNRAPLGGRKGDVVLHSLWETAALGERKMNTGPHPSPTEAFRVTPAASEWANTFLHCLAANDIPLFFLVIGVNEVPPWCTTKASDGRAGPHLG